MWVLEEELLGALDVSSMDSIPAGLAARSCGDSFSWRWSPGVGGAGVGLGLLAPETSLQSFYPPHVDVGPAHSTSVPLLPVWMDMVCSIVVRLPFNSISVGSE